MRRRLFVFFAMAILALTGGTRAQERGSFVVLSDIHFNPFTDPALAGTLAATPPAAWRSSLDAGKNGPLSKPDEDTNYPLFLSALDIAARAMTNADFALVPGDLIAHEFNARAAQALGTTPTAPAVHEMAEKGALFVVESLAGALAGKPAFVALGNVDSGCGDYRLKANGPYLAATKEAVRRLAGAERVAADFDATYGAGGYYAARHPTVPGLLIVALSDALWSTHYRDACERDTGDGEAAALAMLQWLRDLLARQRAAGGRVWMMHHIPWGIDAYSTVAKQAASCPEKVVQFLREPFATDFPALIGAYRDVVQASFSGHTHFDDYRLAVDGRGTVLGLDKMSPAVSPVFGQNPAFQIFAYDRRSGAPSDFSTWYLANPGAAATAADWRFEYTFTAAYGLPSYSPDTVATLWKGLSDDRARQDAYRTLYTVQRGELAAASLPAYACAIGNLTRAAFTACYCGDRR